MLEIAGIAGCLLLSAALFSRSLGLARWIDSPAAWAVFLLAVPGGYLLADFVSGFVHWMADRYGTVNTPVFGPNFVGPFREHHVDPKGITRHDFIETNGANCIVSVPLQTGVLLSVQAEGAGLLGLAATAHTLWLCLFVFATNQFHKWAHADTVPGFVRRLQKWRLILSPDHHQIHHAVPFDTHYCITVGWLNPVLARIRFFSVLERMLRRTIGLKAGEDDAAWVSGIETRERPSPAET